MGKDLKGKELGNGIHQRSDGRYIGRYVNRFGKRVQVGSRNLKELRNLLDNHISNDKTHRNVVDETIVLDDWFSKWLTIHKYKVIRDNTKQLYIQIYNKHISPTLGNFKISAINQLQVKELLRELDSNGYGFETRNKVRILLLDMFNKAMIDDFVFKNPTKGIKLIRDENVDIKALTREEQSAFFECCKGTFYDNLFTVAVVSGLRPGELCALTWEDINLDKMEMSISKTLLYQKLENDDQKKFHIVPPKTKSSYRNVPINKQCEIALRKQKLQRDVVVSKTPKTIDEEFKDLLFTSTYGTPINTQIYSDAIKKIINEINLMRDPMEMMEVFSGHCFRHTFATRCFEANIQPKTVQQYLGHASLSMTMDLYTHVFDDKKQMEMQKLENQLDSLLDINLDTSEERLQEREKTMPLSVNWGNLG